VLQPAGGGVVVVIVIVIVTVVGQEGRGKKGVGFVVAAADASAFGAVLPSPFPLDREMPQLLLP
jgi:hypothetical protein